MGLGFLAAFGAAVLALLAFAALLAWGAAIRWDHESEGGAGLASMLAIMAAAAILIFGTILLA